MRLSPAFILVALLLCSCGGQSDLPGAQTGVDAGIDGQQRAEVTEDTDGSGDGSEHEGAETLATNACAGLAIRLEARAVADACADDASPGAVLPDLGEVVCRDTARIDVTVDGTTSFTLVDGALPNPSADRAEIAWRAWVPSPSADGADGPALVVLLHGFAANLNSLAYQAERLASHGFAVVAITFPNAGFTDPPAHDLKVLEVRAVIDLALDASGPFGGRVDPTKIAVAGHSLGGKIAFYTAAIDPRVDLVVGMDPNNGGGPPCFIGDGCNDFPVAPNCESGAMGVMSTIGAESLVFATEDAALTPDAHLRAVHFYRGAPAPAHILHFADARHAEWIAANETREFSLSVTTALLLRRFYGVNGVDSWLPEGPQVAARIGSLLDYAASR